MCVCNPECSPVGTIADTQPQLQRALLKLSAMISQFFIRSLAIALMIMPVDLNADSSSRKAGQLLICMHNKASSVAAQTVNSVHHGGEQGDVSSRIYSKYRSLELARLARVKIPRAVESQR
jgi:hypothetical protein